MRLAVVCYPTYGGSGVIASELAIQLAEHGHEVHVVSYGTPFRINEWIPNLCLHTVELDSYPLFPHPPYSLMLTNKLIELVEEFGVELIHSHYAIPHASAAWNARQVLRSKGRDVRLACTLHGTDITLVGREAGFHALTRFAIDQQDILTTPSRWLAEDTGKAFGVDPDRIHVIPNFCDLERFSPGPSQARKHLVPDGRFLVSHISNFRPVKRIPELIRAFAALREQADADLALVGDGPDLPAAEQLARELNVRDHIHILGKMDNIEVILRASDLFFLPSRAESFGLAALEALACGCPVIGYRAGGLPEVVEDGISGRLCEEGMDTCLGCMAAELLNDESRLTAMRLAARKRAEGFAPGPIIEQYETTLCS